jgi:hypothetical protein
MELFLSVDGHVLGAGAELLGILGRNSSTVAGLPLEQVIVDAENVYGLLAGALRGGDSDSVGTDLSVGGYTPDVGGVPGSASRAQPVLFKTSDGSTFPHPAHIRVCPLYAPNDGSVDRLLLTFELADSRDAPLHYSTDRMVVEAVEASSSMVVDDPDGPTGGTIEGVRNVSSQAERLLRGMPCAGIDSCSSATQRCGTHPAAAI